MAGPVVRRRLLNVLGNVADSVQGNGCSATPFELVMSDEPSRAKRLVRSMDSLTGLAERPNPTDPRFPLDDVPLPCTDPTCTQCRSRTFLSPSLPGQGRPP